MAKQYRLEYSTQARKDLKSCDKSIASRIVKKLDENIKTSDPLQRATALTGSLQGKYRFRVGNYRAVFVLAEDEKIILLTIIRINHRKDIYR